MQSKTTASITLSKRGYGYQHRYALFTILQRLRQKSLARAYVDYPYENDGGKNSSLDLWLENKDNQSIDIYEVKTGEKFKTDRDAAITKVLHSFYNYNQLIKQKKVHCNSTIIYLPTYRLPILDLQRDLYVVAHGTKKREIKEIIERRYVQHEFGDNEIECSTEDFAKFFSKVKMEEGAPYASYETQSEKLELNESIICVIDSYAQDVGADCMMELIPTKAIITELLDVICFCIESNLDVVVPVVTCLGQCFERRCLARELCNKSPKSIEKEKIIMKEGRKITQKISDLTGIILEEKVTTESEEY